MTSRLFDAICAGDLQSTRKLLEGEENVHINVRNSLRETPLHVAIWNGRHQIAKYLIQKQKANVNAFTVQGVTPLLFLLLSCNETEVTLEIAELLLANGASADIKMPYTRDTALHLACSRGNFQLIQVLLNHGADVNARDYSGNTPLHNTCNIDVIKLLLAYSADRHIKNNIGYGPTDRDMVRLGDVFTSYDKWPLAVPEDGCTPIPKTCKQFNQDGAVRLNPHLSQHQHALALKALLLVRKLPVHEVAYQIMGFLTPAAVEKIF